MKRKTPAFQMRAITLMALSSGALAPCVAYSQSEEAVDLEKVVVEGEVADDLNILPTEPVDSVFGFDKSILETPRSVTSISNEMLNKFNITEIDDLVALSPGSFTQSFFGVAGSLDVRGTPGETYFRGVRRIDNPGNYPTPIAASDRIDIVRGPASPIYGPSKIGGYLNFVPKSARAETGAYLSEPKGELGVIRGSWDKDIIRGEVGGPGQAFGKTFGYYLYAETEDSGSYYQNTSTDQSIYQASFNMDLTDASRIEFGGMYHVYEGNQVAGWNRLTQDLVDNGTYITGSPVSLDANGDGLLSAEEAAAGSLSIFYFGGVGGYDPAQVNADLAAHPNMALIDPGTAHINGNQVLVQEDDILADDVLTLYFDFVHEFGSGVTMTNKTFYEALENINENAYGFSQYADTSVIEDQLIFAFSTTHTQHVRAAYQFSPSIRHQKFEHGDNFRFEYFDRRDITQAGTPVDRRTLATRQGPPLESFSNNNKGDYTVLGAAALADYTFFDDLHLLGGVRYDAIGVTTDDLNTPDEGSASNSARATSWSGSLSYDIPRTGVSPYVTLAKQTTMIVGQGGEVAYGNVVEDTVVADSKLKEYGIKASLLDGRLYTALAYFDQERVDYNAQNTVTNNTTQAEGWEFELRGVVTNNLTVTGAYSTLEVYNLTAKENGFQFGFAGAEDLPAGVDPADMFGGVINGLTFTTDGRKAGVPEEIYSVYLIYGFKAGPLSGLTSSIGVTHVDSVYSGFSKAVLLPSYTLLNAGLNYETQRWKFGLTGKNLTDERYFRSNFPDLFGSSIVLPEIPINWLASVGYKF